MRPAPRSVANLEQRSMQLAVTAPSTGKTSRSMRISAISLPIDAMDGTGDRAGLRRVLSQRRARRGRAPPLFDLGQRPGDLALRTRPGSGGDVPQRRFGQRRRPAARAAFAAISAPTPLPERVATTDLFPVVARLAARAGVSFYMLGGSEEVNRKAVANTRAAYPALRIVGRRNGYFSREEEAEIVEEIAQAAPDVLWISLGVPIEQQFCARNLDHLRGASASSRLQAGSSTSSRGCSRARRCGCREAASNGCSGWRANRGGCS